MGSFIHKKIQLWISGELRHLFVNLQKVTPDLVPIKELYQDMLLQYNFSKGSKTSDKEYIAHLFGNHILNKKLGGFETRKPK